LLLAFICSTKCMEYKISNNINKDNSLSMFDGALLVSVLL